MTFYAACGVQSQLVRTTQHCYNPVRRYIAPEMRSSPSSIQAQSLPQFRLQQARSRVSSQRSEITQLSVTPSQTPTPSLGTRTPPAVHQEMSTLPQKEPKTCGRASSQILLLWWEEVCLNRNGLTLRQLLRNGPLSLQKMQSGPPEMQHPDGRRGEIGAIDEYLIGHHSPKTKAADQAITLRAKTMTLPNPILATPTHPATNLRTVNQTQPAANPTDWEDTIAE